MPMDDAEYKSPSKPLKRGEHGQANLESRPRDIVFPSFLKGKNDQSLQARTVDYLSTDQRVVTFLEDKGTLVRGTVRYIGEEKDASGRVLVGLELDERIGTGTGKWKGRQLFVGKQDYAAFVDKKTVIPERDFDSDPGEATTRATSQKQDKQRTGSIKLQKRQNDEMFPRSSSYDLNETSGKLRRENAPLRSSNSFDFSNIMLAAGESSKTDSREFIEKQREMLDEFKRSKLSPSYDVPMYDIEGTDSASSSDHLNFEDKRFKNSPLKEEPITEQPRDFVYIDKEDYDKLFKKDESSDSVPRECILCGDAVATFECKRCSPKRMFGEDDERIASYCSDCNVKVHSRKRADHEIKPLLVPRQFDTQNVPDKQKMDLQQQERNIEEHLANYRAQFEERNLMKARLVEKLKKKESQQEISQRQLLEREEQIREKEEDKADMERQLEVLQQQLREMKECLATCQAQLKQRHLSETSLTQRLQEKERQQANSQRQLQEMVEQIRQKEDDKANLERQLEVSQQQLREKEQCLTNCQTQMEETNLRETSFTQQLQEKELQQENSQRQLREMEEQIREKEDDKANLERQLEVLQQQLREKEQCLANYQAQLEETNLRETNLVQQLQEKELQRENSQKQLQEIEEQIREKEDNKANSERQLREMALSFEERIREKEEEKTNLETQLGMKNQELSELETSLTEAQQMIIELRRQESCDWVISRGEVQVKDKCLGKGAWGSVNEATYCGCKVAVKQIHELILSAHNIRLFEREMNIASRCRHPCLLQFIGATNDEGSPLFVTELMELSLRALLGQRQLTETEISVISLDVSRALNYLHHMKPSPIVHRDVSSANVLLWRQGEQWRGKVSDYGTARFVQQTMTVAPGALIYSAPEAVSSNQTSKVDVYSFGVLLCEMCIRDMPDPARRKEQVILVRNGFFRNLVRQCLQADPAMRPDMAQIIQELKQFDGTDRLN
ncbi:probable serine/threonine-protein kinase drkD isoform X2 [Montipora foliosa]